MPNQEAEIAALKQCIRELIQCGDDTARWHRTDHPKRIAWRDARERAGKIMDATGSAVPTSHILMHPAMRRSYLGRQLGNGPSAP